MKACPQCGMDLPETARFCMGCGTSLSEGASEPTSTTNGESADLRDSQGGLYKPTGPVEQHFGNRYDVAGNLILQQPASIPQQPTCDSDVALACYLTHVIEANARLQLQGIRSAQGLVSIALEEIYITLSISIRARLGSKVCW